MDILPRIQTDQPLRDPRVLELRDRLRGGELTREGPGGSVAEAVTRILRDIELRGDAACLEWTARLDRADLTADRLRVEGEALARAHAQADAELMALVRRSAENVRRYQESILTADPPELLRGGRRLSVRYTPVAAAAVYVPGGRAAYPSSVVMTVVPAQVAGVGRIVVTSPPSCEGEIHPLVLATAAELGVEEVYRLGGAVAVGALATGTESVPAVDKIVGPGNAYVAEAKRQVFGRVGIDSIAGPSEVLIVADSAAEPAWVAADLLAQAEHDPGSAILVTPDASLAESVSKELARQLGTLERAEAIRAALQRYSAIVVVDTLTAACAVAGMFATEHLQIITGDDEFCLANIRAAGAIFLGPHTPVALGDYFAGPSHVLPTGGTARFFGPLSCNDFRKASSIIRYDAASAAADAADVAAFARSEGLTAHARAMQFRARNEPSD